ncbi:hypothetical protein PAXRUDRAFT_15748 [Paxillus rubicundulus Ve08.2h10]|uniref:Uncharacterized protein n=1 Tax=Paxillus rubicundulus Ve08.2h10 TaxID=930991 RepID=A0A0D0D9P4_9AGAM|nr:hypothetical protein PAXRUDRAFT_15748 [Paxillus rubicundulus Ve08.2h10]
MDVQTNPEHLPDTQSGLQNPCVKMSTIVGEFRTGDEHALSLKPLLVTVCFQGTLPRQLAHQGIPIQVSVSVAEEYRSFTTPIIEAISWDTCDSEHSMSSDEMAIIEEQDGFHDPQPDISIPFLPLPAEFNPTKAPDWNALSTQIETWLITKVSMSSQHWTWGHDAFWLTFIAAYPAFPGGKWHMWNSKIVPVGEFVAQWLSMSHPAQATRDLPNWRVEMCRYIMEEFCKHASLFHPTPIPELR